ncbi:citrate (Pro-3S)-lyase ligase [Candidatus Vecturithrix granuli]|uniref:[Citrate [pro-3S]-lyase] ligase n=1 Tax=Vecturithrix granuli TaxID=1499967 RepID=A0A081BWA7_VECG1|nr:citrate (Pro-3S)-lyase ligase [Candidatus Vecturithrix granuli]
MEQTALKQIFLSAPKEREQVGQFLARHGLKLEPDLEYTVGLYVDNLLIGTGSLSKRVLKCIAIDDAYKGMGMTNKIVSHLSMKAYQQGQTHLFIYTKPENVPLFEPLGFYAIYELHQTVTLLENTPIGLQDYLKSLRAKRREAQQVGAVVVNCNPFTLGHRYLIESAAARSEVVHVFVVQEDRSVFPFEVRYRLVKEGVSDLERVSVHQGGDYIISQATFPSYFLKESQQVDDVHARLDAGIFAKYIAPTLGITIRFVGNEPLCPVTSHYNQMMKSILPAHGIEVIELERKQKDGEVISASRVRKFLCEGRLEEIRKIVPETTYRYLISEEAQSVIKQIKHTK